MGSPGPTTDGARNGGQVPGLHADAAGTLHDFNNALQAIGASLTRLRNRVGRDEGGVPALVDTMQEQVVELAALGALLVRGSEAASASPKPLELGPFLSAMEAQIEALLPPAIRLEVAVERNAGMLSCPPARLASVVRNLVLNARDAMAGGGSLVIRARRVRLGGADGGRFFAEVTVRDTGHGMAPDMLRRCLDPFVTTRKGSGGSGLGLHQVRLFAQGMGGSVRLQSREGEGTTAVLLLPDGGVAWP